MIELPTTTVVAVVDTYIPKADTRVAGYEIGYGPVHAADREPETMRLKSSHSENKFPDHYDLITILKQRKVQQVVSGEAHGKGLATESLRFRVYIT